MTSEALIQKAEDFYKDRIIEWMIPDLKKSVEAGTNYLTVLGCLVYTEVIGIFLPPFSKETVTTQSRRFYRCLFCLQSCAVLRQVDKILKKETSKNIYEQLRHNAAHLYFPSIRLIRNGSTLFVPLSIARDSYIETPDTGKKVRSALILFGQNGELVIASNNYTLELEKLIQESYQETFIKKDPQYEKAAIEGINVFLRGY